MWIPVRVVWRLPLAMTLSRRGGIERQRLERPSDPILSRIGSLAWPSRQVVGLAMGKKMNHIHARG